MVELTTDDRDALQASLEGVASLPGDAAFDAAVNIWNGVIDRRPAIVASCASSADVAGALAFARERGLEISVRGGGHNYAGFALCDGGLMIDLTPMKAVRVDPAAKRATCGGGTTWGELDGATQEHGLAVPGGFVSHTGVAGLTLGGGFGWLSRTAGLTADNLVAAEVVLADGTVVRASDDADADLFWALRGGGGNFGVVTSFEFALHEVGPLVNLALFFFVPDDGGAMFRFARDFVRALPDENGALLAALSAPPEPFVPADFHFAPVYALGVVGFGSAEAHAAAVAPVRDALTPAFELVTPIPYTALQQMFNGSAPWGVLAYEKALYLHDLSDGAIDVLLRRVPGKASPLSLMPIFVLGGEYSRAEEDGSCFAGRRDVGYLVNISAGAMDRDTYEHERTWVRDTWSDLVPHAGGVGSYVNFMSEFEEERVRASYGPSKYERLQQLKARYDPDNVFHLNANIRPDGVG